MDFTDLFRAALKSAGYSHERFGEAVGVTGAFVSLVATRRSKLPIDKIDAWADALKLTGAAREEFRQATHLAHSSEDVRQLVRSLQSEAENDRLKVIQFQEKLTKVVAHLRSKGVDLPKGIEDF